ncbi:DUF2867 domain-containing protein [Alistipes sp.]|uniref:DUF2867 domain-containing protein n=1 Tax=Alistipes sp. TaxID=1872444 RepID=UPI003AB89AFA
MKIHRSPLPANSLLARYPAMDYSDCFRGRLPGTQPVSPNELMAAFWTTMPAWLNVLFKIRDLLVRPFGLKTGTADNREELQEALLKGKDYGLMSAVAHSADESVISLDDKHLKAYFSIYIEGRDVYITTLVQFHNKLGVAYFNLIRPFHKIVVKNIFRQVMREHGI